MHSLKMEYIFGCLLWQKTHPLRPTYTHFTLISLLWATINVFLVFTSTHPEEGERIRPACVFSCCPAACNVTPGCIRCSAPRLACSLPRSLGSSSSSPRCAHSQRERRGARYKNERNETRPQSFFPARENARALAPAGRVDSLSLIAYI